MKSVKKVLRSTKGHLGNTGIALLRMLLVAYFVLPPTGNSRAQGPAAISFQLPLERAGNSFTVQESDGTGGLISTPITSGDIANVVSGSDGNLNATAESYLQGSAPAPSNDYYIRDETSGDRSPPNLLGTPSFDRTSFLSTPWYSEGSSAPAFYISLPADRYNDVLSLVTSGTTTYPISKGPQLAYETTDQAGQPVLAYYGFFNGSATDAPAGEYFVLDSTTHEQSSVHLPTEHNLDSGETWTSFTGAVPTRLLTIFLDESEGPATFLLHTPAGSVEALTPQWQLDAASSRYRYSVSASLGINQPFWLERQQDHEATAMEWIGITDLSMDGTDTFTPYLPPVVVSFDVGENHWPDPIVVDLGNGTSVPAYPDRSTVEYKNAVDYLNRVYYSYAHEKYTASVDAYVYAAQAYLWRDAWTGSSDLMDGFNPPVAPAPNPQTVTIVVGENHWYDTIFLTQAQPSGSQIFPSTWTDGGAQTANDSLGVPYYYYRLRNYYFTIDANQDYRVVDSSGATNFVDGFNPPYNPNDPVDLSSLSVQIAACRWNDTLQVRTSYGDVWPLQVDQMQGFWTADQSGQSWFTSYYYFSATG